VSADPAERPRAAPVERTVLAWNRAAIAVAANGALLVRAGFVHHSPALEAFGLGVSFLGFALWTLSLVRSSAIAGRPVPHVFGREMSSVLPIASFVLLVSIVDLVVIVSLR
jgi:uncharacterized membrane protein YidH (DUF202 family)